MYLYNSLKAAIGHTRNDNHIHSSESQVNLVIVNTRAMRGYEKVVT